MSDGLEWDKRSNYAVTELILFSLASLILFVSITVSFIYSYIHLNYDVSFFSTLRPLFENVFQTAVAFTPARRSGEGKEPPKIILVFIGSEERSPDVKSTRTWVYVYFILLCGLIILWAVSIFSDSVLYRKMSSCNDISVEDEDLSCFLLSDRDVPEGIQEIIDQQEGEKVPCAEVQRYIENNSLTFDLEVICYQYQLNPVAALGISYGAIKTVSFIIVSLLSAMFAFVNKLFKRHPRNVAPDGSKPKKISVPLIVTCHVFFFILALACIAIFAIIIAVIHEITGLKNSGYDLLRGEKFHSYSVVVLVPVTLIFISFVPWWAFDPLQDESPEWDIDFSDADKLKVKRKMYRFVHRSLLHQQFSTPLATLFEVIWATGIPAQNAADVENGRVSARDAGPAELENSNPTQPDNAHPAEGEDNV